MKNTRKIGEDKVKEVKELIEKWGHKTSGPFHKLIWVRGRMSKVHHDLFGVGDFLSLSPEGNLYLHQVTSSNMKSNKVKKIKTLGVKCILWIYDSEDLEEKFRVFEVTPVGTFEVKYFLKERLL